MSPNGGVKRNRLEGCCAFKWLNLFKIIKCHLTVMLFPSTYNYFLLPKIRLEGLMNVNVKMTMFVFSCGSMSLAMDIITGWRGQLTLFAPFVNFSNFCYFEHLLNYGLIGVLLLSYIRVLANENMLGCGLKTWWS
jgi:hypothetical protein